jgi:hypothetical protein
VVAALFDMASLSGQVPGLGSTRTLPFRPVAPRLPIAAGYRACHTLAQAASLEELLSPCAGRSCPAVPRAAITASAAALREHQQQAPELPPHCPDTT